VADITCEKVNRVIEVQLDRQVNIYQITGTVTVGTHTHSDYINTSLQAGFLLTANSSLLQTAGAYLTTAMLSQNTSLYLLTANSSLLQTAGAYLTTAMQSNNTFSQYINTSKEANFFLTANSSLLQTAGAYLTTAMASDKTYSQYINTSVQGSFFLTANSSLLQAAGAYLTTAALSQNSSLYAGLNLAITGGAATLNTSGLSINITGGVGGGAALKGSGTYTQNSGTIEFANGNNVSFGLVSNQMTASIANYLTTAAVSNHTHSDLYQATGAYLTTAMQSGESHIREINVSNGSFYQNTVALRAQTNITLSADGASIKFSVADAIALGNSTLFQSVGAYLTTAALSQNSSLYAGLNLAITGGSATLNTSGLSINITGGGGGLANIVEDLTPQLGGDLDLNNHKVPKLDYLISDNRKQNKQLSDAYNLTYADENIQTVTLASGENQIHGTLFAKGKIFATTNTSPAKILRFNNLNDLTDYNVLTFASDGKHNQSPDLIYDATKDRIYVMFTDGDFLTVSEIDPDHVAWDTSTDVVADGTRSTAAWGSICCDGSYLYMVNYSTSIYKISLSDFSVTTGTLAHGLGHCIRYDGTYLYATSVASPGVIHKILPSDLSIVAHAHFANGDDTPTDDLAFAGDYIWVGLEVATNSYVLKIKKSDLSIQRVDTGTVGVVYSMFFDGKYVWVCHATTKKISRIDPVTHEIFSYTPTNDYPNEIISDGQRLFIFYYQSPSLIERLCLPPLTRYKKLYIPAMLGRPMLTGGCSSYTLFETASNAKTYGSLDFDKDTDEHAQFDIALPLDYTAASAVIIKLLWTASAGTANQKVYWNVYMATFADDSAMGINLSIGGNVNDTLLALEDLHICSLSALTLTAAQAGNLLTIYVNRDADNGSDNLAGDARLLGIIVDYI
jgi:hypothetical protein